MTGAMYSERLVSQGRWNLVVRMAEKRLFLLLFFELKDAVWRTREASRVIFGWSVRVQVGGGDAQVIILLR